MITTIRLNDVKEQAVKWIVFLTVTCVYPLVAVCSAEAMPVIDGNVAGLSEGYTRQLNVNFNIESGPSNVPGGKLFLHESGSDFFAGLIIPLTIVDNTYGTNRSLDWGTKDHFLMGGGDGLEGSDEWKDLKIQIPGEKELKVEFDYISHVGSNVFSSGVKKAEQKDNGDFDASDVVLKSSLHYNYHTLGLTQFFDSDKNNPIASPGPAPGPANNPVYDFDSPAEDWVAEIMYELTIDKSDLNGTFDAAAFIDAFNKSTLHISPNKLGRHKVFPTAVQPVPEPAACFFWSFVIATLALVRRCRVHAFQ